MNQIQPEKILNEIPRYREIAENVSRGLHDQVLQGGKPARTLADLLHGTWLGHPLHAVLTDAVLGAWMLGGFFDWIGLSARSPSTRESAERAADTLLAIGTASAVPTALAGLADYTTIPRRAMTTGATHGILNVASLVLNLLSMASRKNGQRGKGIFLSAMSLGLLTVSAWLGGELVYKYGVSTNKTIHPKEPLEWIPVMDENELAEQQPRRVKLADADVLVYRYGGAVYAIGAVCGHDGGPLDEGQFDGLCVECPWHHSVFDLRDGSVVHGPSTYSVANYAARSRNGKIELRLED